ncbi:MAG: protein translocase subunit SecD [Candidatus Blackburnbacteria bacterium]|nr:protein translocase subunit SecD [Candidatus Blackburnbacteria bacterium]
MKHSRQRFLIILLLTGLSLFAALPRELPIKFRFQNFFFDRVIQLPGLNLGSGNVSFRRDLELKLGLDLAGGSHLVFEADMSKISAGDREAAIEGTRATIERRVNLFGVSEAQVQTAKVGGAYRVNVDLPGVKDSQGAIELIGQTARLEFKEFESVPSENSTESSVPFRIVDTDLSGADLERGRVEFDSQTGKPVVGLQFNSEGAKKFQEITKRNIGKQVAILVDNQIITAPTVQQEISGGNAIITGDFTLDEAKQLAIQLNSGALPVPVKIIEQRTIEASLGKEQVRASIAAGIVGLSMVVLFMVLYYGKLGFLGSVGLLIYGVVTIALYKFIPVVLTLPGVAGLILSVGMAVDSNILIFERMKEELRAGKPWPDSMEAGFGRAWDSIRDANIATLVTVFILLNPLNFTFLHTSGPVRGFALTLGLGILISLFTGIFVTRTLMRIFAREKHTTYNKEQR